LLFQRQDGALSAAVRHRPGQQRAAIHLGAALLGHTILQTTRGYVTVVDETACAPDPAPTPW
jgi:hypothetical protein